MTSISEMIQGAIKAAIIEKYEAAETEELKNDLINKLGKVEWSSVTLDVFEKMKDTFETLKGTMFEHVYYKGISKNLMQYSPKYDIIYL